MIDIHFYQKVAKLKKKIMNGDVEDFSKNSIMEMLESYRSREPTVYNTETTNACPMSCIMCPRTTMMTRPIVTMGMGTFSRVAYQLRAWTKGEWDNWKNFVKKYYHIDESDMSENHFFLHIIPRVLVLHGYGSPLVDKHIVERVKLLSELKIPSYFSDNPANIRMQKTEKLMEYGLDYLKFSIEAVSDKYHKHIRGEASNFTEGYEKILKLLNIKKKEGYNTVFVITMLDIEKRQKKEFTKLKKKFEGKDVYIYFKSQDQQWYQDKKKETKSIHWTEFCQFPWSSLTVKSNGEVVMCVEDFNNEIILGDAKTDRLYDIWNGEKYMEFRKWHFTLSKCKCTTECDMKLIGSLMK